MSNKNNPFELSIAQQSIVLNQLRFADSPMFNIGGYIRCKNIDVANMNAAHRTVVKQNDAFGLRIETDGQHSQQTVSAARDIELPLMDFSAKANPDEAASVWLKDLFGQAIPYQQRQLCQAWLVKLDQDHYWYVGLGHHLAMDGWGFHNWAKQLAQVYAEPKNKSLSESPAGLRWQDIVIKDQQYLNSKRYHADKSYWQQHCRAIDNLDLRLNDPRHQGQDNSPVSRRHVVAVSRQLFGQIEAFATAAGVGIPQLFLAVLALNFCRSYHKSNVCFGIPVHNRRNKQEKDAIGMFIGMSPLVIEVDRQSSFSALVSQIAKLQSANYRHQRYPLTELIQDCGLAGVDNPLYQVMFNYLKLDYRALAFGADNAEVIFANNAHQTMPLAVNVWDGDGEVVEMHFDHNLGYFSAVEIELMGARVLRLLTELVQQPELPVGQIDLLPPAEYQQLLQQGQGPSIEPTDDCIHQLFERQVSQHPDKIALICDEEQLSYQQLNQQANQLAHYLVNSYGVKPDTLVGICLARSVQMVVAILAVLKAGGAYVPMDPDYPVARLTHMRDDAGLETVITESTLLQPDIPAQSSANLTIAGLTSAHLAYVIYTSGSTGLPKGVMIEHRNVSNFLASMAEQPGLSGTDRLLAVTSTSFDIHVLELFLPLVNGAQLVIAHKAATLDPALLSQLMTTHAITVMQATPASWKMLLDADWQPATALKVLCGGEALSQSLARALLAHDGIELWNMYGPTETTIWSSTNRIYPDDRQILLGRPIANTRFYVLGEALALAPLGVPGELLIGGAGLARGYFGQAELTAQKFIDTDERLYKTGDLVRRLADGQIEYLGRLDHQVKVRGFRVELAEVEQQLLNNARVKDAVVVTQETADGSQGLVAYVVTEANTDTEQPLALDFSLFYFGAQNGGAQNNDSNDKYGFYLKSAQFADQHGFSAIWTPERHFDPVGALYPNPSVLSAALSSVTQHIQLRAGSVVMPLHDPVRVAEEWSVVDNLSQGRVGMAVASGWHSRDFVLAPDNFEQRKQRVGEGIASLKTLWQGNTIERLDGNGQPVKIEIFPKPVQKTLPLWMTAAGNPQTFIEAGRQGTHVLTHLLGQTLTELTRNISLYRQSLAQHGHDPAAGQVTLMVHTFIGDDLEQVQQHARGPFIEYMRAHVALVQPLLKSLDIASEDIDNQGIDSQGIDDIVNFAFARYSQTAALIGTSKSCLPMVEQIIAAGVTEVGCLVDWMDEDSAYAGLQPLWQLAQNSRELSLSATSAQQALNSQLHDQLRYECYRHLPDYMVPSTFMLLDALPLTPNGKIDRKALPSIDVAAGAVYRPPVSDSEISLSAIWQQVLKVERVGLDDNFFQLGGHSLLASQIVGQINQTFRVNLPLEVLFNTPDLQALALRVDQPLPQLAGQSTSQSVVVANTERALLPPSFGQQRLWLVDQIEAGSAHYNDAFALQLSGEPDLAAMAQAFTTIVERHESLRTCFVGGEGTLARPVIMPPSRCPLKVVDLTSMASDLIAAKASELVNQEALLAFDLSADMMLRTRLIKTAPDQLTLLITLHHIATDGWSIGVLMKEFAALYTAYSQGKTNPLPPLAIQYSDYALWQRQWLALPDYQQQLDYWQQQLAQLPLTHQLVLDHARPKQQSFNGGVYRSVLPSAITEDLNQLCQAQNVTQFMGLHAVFATLVARYSHETDIVIGTPIANREQAEVADLIGFFVNTLVLRCDLSAQPSFVELLAQSKTMLLDAYAHQQVPFDRIVERLQPQRSIQHSPLFQLMLVFNNNDIGEMFLPGLQLASIQQHQAVAKYDLVLNVTPLTPLTLQPQGLALSWLYNSDLFSAQTIAGMNEHFTTLLSALVKQPDEDVFKAAMMSPAQIQKNLEQIQFKAAPSTPSISGCVHDGFETQAALTPDAIAVEFEQQQLSYGELNQQANQLAHHLINHHGVKPDTLVGICLERSTQLVVAILAVLKAGGAYVPMDPDAPSQRLAYIRENAALETVIDDAMLRVHLADLPTSNPARQGLTSSHLAYVIYTSGSTGQPKGVMVEHGNVVRLLTSTEQDFQFGPSDCLCMFHSFAFDFSVWELWGALNYGGRLVVVPQWVARTPADFYALVQRSAVTVLNQTPTAFIQFAQQDMQQGLDLALRTIVFGGEALNLGELNGWLARHGDQSPQLINMYGITETTVHVTYRRLLAADIAANQGSLIGRPLSDLQVYVLNPALQLVPEGLVGEMYVAGPGVSRGYLNNDALTAQRFIDNPFVPGQRLYRTGDLACYHASKDNGNELEYKGRIDEQVKIRGYRIELGEIEQQLSGLSLVDSSVVVVHQHLHQHLQQQQLLAYIKVAAGIEHSDIVNRVRTALAETLPSYMLPGAFVVVEQWPLTVNGKVNKAQLPAVDETLWQTNYVAPSSVQQQLLCQIWQQVLELAQVGIEDNFFNLGGDSIVSIRVVAELKNQGYGLSVKQLFEYPTIGQLAEHLTPLSPDQQPSALQPFALLTESEKAEFAEVEFDQHSEIVDVYPLSALQSGMVFHSQQAGFDGVYHDIMAEHIRCPWQQPAFEQALEAVISAHPLLRSGFTLSGQRPLQHVFASLVLPLVVEDIRDLDEQSQLDYLASWTEMRKSHEFDWQYGPLFQVNIFLRTDDSFEFVFSFHHAILDGWSLATLNTSLFNFYSRLLAGETPAPLAEEWIYREFIALELQTLQDPQASEHFQQMLADAPVRQVPHKVAAQPQQPRQQQTLTVTDMKALSADLAQLAQRLNVPLQSVLLAAHVKVLSLLSGAEQVVSCVTHNGRPEQTGSERGLGLYLNSLPLALTLPQGADVSWAELIRAVASMSRENLNHRRYPLAAIQKQLDRTFGEVTFNYTHFHVYQQLEHQGVDIERLGSSGFEQTNFDFHVDIARAVDDDALLLSIHYNSHLFTEAQIEHISQYYLRVWQLCIDDVNSRHQVSLLSEPQQDQLQQWAVGAAPSPLAQQGFYYQFGEQNPHAIAVVCGEVSLSYQALATKAQRLANYLQAMDIVQGSRVGLYLPRGIEQLIALLGTALAGASYVALEPGLPPARLSYMVEDADIELLILPQRLTDSLSMAGLDLLLSDEMLQHDWLAEFAGPCAPSTDLNDEAYVLYTSGSSGKPKGVSISQANLSLYLAHAQTQYINDNIDGAVVSSPLCFDATITSLLTPLCIGKTVHLLADGDAALEQLPDYLFDPANNWLFKLTPAHLQALVYSGGKSGGEVLVGQGRHMVVVGGEQWTVASLNQWKGERLPNSTFINEYGPTETVVGTSTFTVENAKQLSALAGHINVPIGQAIAGSTLLVVGAGGQLQPVNSAGELYIGGAALSRGYVNLDGQTQAQFVDYYGQRLYKSGDLVRRLADGQLAFIGRADEQVKIHGYRIELGEVKSCLQQLTGIEQVEVLVVQHAEQGPQLVAYVVADDSANLEHLSLEKLCREHVAQYLPSYMQPAAYVQLPNIPLTTNGKVDRQALPDAHRYGVDEAAQTHVAPGSSLEQLLAEVWSQVLKVEQVGVNDNFFSLGGDSILSIRVVSLLKNAEVYVTVKDLFGYQTISELATFIAANDANDSNQGQQTELEPLSSFALLSDDESAAVADLDIEDAYPLSTLQAGMVFHSQLAEFDGIYHDIVNEHIVCPWQPELFAQALSDCIAANPILRSIYLLSGHRPLQLVQAEITLPLVVEDLRTMDPQTQQPYLDAWIHSHKRHVFDWANGPLYQVNIFRCSDDSFAFVFSFHHSLLDGWSRASLTTSLYNRYRQLLVGVQPSMLSVQHLYRDFIALEQQALADDSARAHFIEMLADAPGMQLAVSQESLSPESDSQSHYKRWSVDAFGARSADLIALAVTLGVPLQVILQTLHFKVLAALSGKNRVMSNVVHNGRPEIDGGELALGLFLNSLPMVINMVPGSWRLLINQVMSVNNDNIKHRHYPLATIGQDTGLDFSEILFNYTHFHVFEQLSEDESEQAMALLSSASFEQTNYHFSVEMQRGLGDQPIDLNFDYDANRYSDDFVGQMAGYFMAAADALLADVDGDCYGLSLLAEQQRDHLLGQLNDTAVDYPHQACVHAQFEAQVQRLPHAVAIEQDGQHQSLSYQQLNQQANQLAHHLINQHQVKPDTLVGICLERCPLMVVAVLAVLKAGGAYVPLEPSYPTERLATMQGDANLATVISHSSLQSKLSQLSITSSQVLCLDTLQYPTGLPDTNPQVLGLTANHLAYLIYTSGSSGKPKGVAVKHQGVVNYLQHCSSQYYPQVTGAVVSSPLAFDATVTSLLGALVNGKRLILLDENVDLSSLSALMFRLTEPTLFKVTPAHLQGLSYLLSGQRISDVAHQLVVGGEALPTALAQQWLQQHLPEATMVNEYGPTETVVGCSTFTITAQSCPLLTPVNVPIGQPIANTRLLVLGEDMAPVGVGTPGQLYIGGAGVARGYLNRQVLTDSRFIKLDSLSDDQYWYQSGDLVSWAADDQLVFLGRIDEQVKIRGFRIEPGEIEHALKSDPGVSDAVVVAKMLPSNELGLVAYVVGDERDDHALDGKLGDYLSQSLPDYMQPTLFVYLAQLPLTANGKIDRQALPEPDMAQRQSSYIAPQDDTQRIVCDVWQQVLGLERVGINDDFFDLGGHSLLVMQVISRLQAAGVAITARQLFEGRTVAAITTELLSNAVLSQITLDTQADKATDEIELTV